jgi:hypothetical protein
VDGNVLANETSGRNLEFKLSLDLLRNSCQFILIESNIGSIQRLQNNIASVTGRFGRIACQL